MARIKANPAKWGRERMKRIDRDDVESLLRSLARTWGIPPDYRPEEEENGTD